MTSPVYASLLHRLGVPGTPEPTPAQDDACQDLRDVLSAMVGLVAERTPDTAARLIDAALVHGEDARRRGQDAEALMEEYARLRQAFWRLLHEGAPLPESDAEAVTRVDAVTTIAMRAGLLGHSRAELEHAGRWHSVREQLLAEAANA